MSSVPDLDIVGDRTVWSVLAAGAELHPERDLLVYDDLEGGSEIYSWRATADRSEALAATFLRSGAGPGSRLHLHLGNRPEFLFAWFAAARIGAAIVPTNPASVPRELAYILDHSQAAITLTDESGVGTVSEARSKSGVDGRTLVCETDLAGGSDLSGCGVDAELPRSHDDLGVIYTSGTTSRPKGVRVTHANYVYAGETVAAALRLNATDRFLTVLPLFHANAQYYSTMGTLVAGGTIVLARRFTASGYADLAIHHRATVGSLFAAPIRMILAAEPQPHWLRNDLRTVVFAQDLTDQEYEQWNASIGAPLIQLYGMTETIGPPVMNSVGGISRHDAIGRPVLGYSCRIVREDGSSVFPGEQGELLVAGVPGVSLMAGYLDDPEASDAVMSAGWLATGDVVKQEPDGLIRFVGRTRDMIKRAGENVAAGEVEEVLREHPMVRDAAVLGVPDPVRDEEIIAFVVAVSHAQLDEADLRRWCTERLAPFRVPTHFSVEPDLPRTAVGKVLKHELRSAWEERCGPAAGLKETLETASPQEG
jgi:carnitine-CoA ligase